MTFYAYIIIVQKLITIHRREFVRYYGHKYWRKMCGIFIFNVHFYDTNALESGCNGNVFGIHIRM
jgi:hypothetical protein